MKRCFGLAAGVCVLLAGCSGPGHGPAKLTAATPPASSAPSRTAGSTQIWEPLGDPSPGGGGLQYAYTPMPGEVVLSDSAVDVVDPFTLVSVVQVDDATYVKYTYQFWYVDTTSTAPSYAGTGLLALESQGLISDSTVVFSGDVGYAYLQVDESQTPNQARVAAINSAPPNVPPAPSRPPGGHCPCARRMTWGELKAIYR
jgi:hypothetical protein